jgi:hypothetical protein
MAKAKKKAVRKTKSTKAKSRKSASRKKDTGVVLWVENLLGMNTKKKAKSHSRKATRKTATSKKASHSLKAKKSSSARKKYAK